MFKSQNFCHIASNNRNQVKVGVFVYRTTDNLETVLTSGYFNDRIIDINLHDLIIHEQVSNLDNTDVQKNVLCVTERTLENVGTTLIKSKWEGDIEQEIENLQEDLDGKVDKTSQANKVYGTDADGNQMTYDKGSFGQVDDVQVNNVSVVTDKVAKIDLTPYVTLSTTQAITGTKTFKSEILSWNNITFESAQANPIIRGMSGASYRNMITRTNSASAIDVGNTSDTINLKGSGTRPTYNSNNLALYSDIGNATITITQGGTTVGSFTTNQSGDQTIALDSGGYHPDLFDVKWADHICNDVQWLRADTFSWQSASVYQAAYQHLTDDITGKTLQSETIAGTTIQFYLADDGHKICPASEESNVTAIFNSTAVAWYYIIDTTNQRFKLPRTKFGFTGIRSGVGGFVKAALPNITGSVAGANQYGKYAGFQDATGAFYADDNGSVVESGAGGSKARTLHIDASRSSSIYGNSNTVQPKATEMYLYFYVGQFTQTALENTAGLNAELFNSKADVSTVAHVVTEFQAPNADNGYMWYRKYADGWVEQGGIVLQSSSAKQTVSLPIEMSGSTYSVLANPMDDSLSNYVFCVKATDKTTTSFKSQVWGSYNQGIATSGYNFVWQVNGMAA